jgi:hypothetical protein
MLGVLWRAEEYMRLKIPLSTAEKPKNRQENRFIKHVRPNSVLAVTCHIGSKPTRSGLIFNHFIGIQF